MKLHVSFKVDELEPSIQFYSRLFGQDPTIVKDDYVKWDVDNPPVNFVVETTGCCPGSGFDHLGIQVDTIDELEALTTRIQDSGQKHTRIERTRCCYATSDKAWVQGMAAEPWEAFLTHNHDNEDYGDDCNPLDER